MHRHQRLDAVREIDQASAVLVDRGDFPEHALRRGGAHRHHQIGFDRAELAFVGHPDTFNSIGFVHVNNRRQSRLTPRDILALY
jgi:hypothetical protein